MLYLQAYSFSTLAQLVVFLTCVALFPWTHSCHFRFFFPLLNTLILLFPANHSSQLTITLMFDFPQLLFFCLLLPNSNFLLPSHALMLTKSSSFSMVLLSPQKNKGGMKSNMLIWQMQLGTIL